MNLSVRQLRAFVALAQERHFTKAAERCHQTQPAFSASIRSLEDAVGARLFDRTTRKVELTPEGLLFLDTALRLLNDLDSVSAEIRDHVALRKGRVAVAALPSLASGWLPAIYADFRKDYPGIRLELHDALLDPCLHLVRTGSADIAVAAKGRDMSGLLAEPLCEDVFYLVCRRDHALARKESVHLHELRGQPFIHLGRNSSIRQSLARHTAVDALDACLEVDHLATVSGLVLAGLGISLVPEMTLFHFQDPALAVVRLAPDSLIKRSLYLIRRQDKSLSSAAAAFHERLMESRGHMPLVDTDPGTI